MTDSRKKMPFLRQVADHYHRNGGLTGRCFVFPNRRSMVFFRKYLCEAVAGSARGGKEAVPVILPRMLTINDLFHEAAGVQAGDRVRLLLELYDCYRELNPKAESLDDFIFWGDVILGDFNDVDKYLVDVSQLFTNVADYKELQDNFSYLSDTQRNAIENFLRHFHDRNGRLTVDIGSDAPDMKARFLQIWNILLPLYQRFNEVLKEKGMAYEGMVYRRIAEGLGNGSLNDFLSDTPGTVYVFVGLNALNECEKTLMRKLKVSGNAEFCWDWSGDMIRDPQNRSSFFMADNVQEFPQVRQWDTDGLGIPEVNVISVASSAGQAKRLPDILEDVPDYGDCAVVLPDENLLVPVLNSIPETVRDINVTMGLPMGSSLFHAMMTDIASIQLHAVNRRGVWHFYHKQVWNLFSSSIFRNAADAETMEIVASVKAGARYYIPQEELSGSPLLETIFRPVLDDQSVASVAQIDAFASYQKDVIRAVAPSLVPDRGLSVEAEFAKEYYRCINILQEIRLEVLPVTYVRLLAQLLGSVSVPFRGEPLKGLQIMGPLETRALDFSNLIIMSANEGIFPRRNVSSSFIPPELRRGFGMPTYEYQDAVWAYYFYRMISRADKVWMLVDSRSEGLKSGEESRYIKQLQYHFGLPVRRHVVKFGSMKASSMPPIVKTEEDVEVIRSTVLSATVLQNYLACPAKFYYGTVRGLKAEETVAESLDYGMFGTVYHEVMRSVYSSDHAMREDFRFDDAKPYGGLHDAPMTVVTKEHIKTWLGRLEDIRRKVKALIMTQLSAVEISGRNLVVTDVIVRYVMKTLQRDLELIEESGRGYFEILGREVKVHGEFYGQRFKGFIDRLDSLSDGDVRVVDYKTGRVLDEDENINDDNAEDIAGKIFAPDVKERPKIALQFFIYDMLVRLRPETAGRRIFNCVYSTAHIFNDRPVAVPLNVRFYEAVSDRLVTLLEEMYDTSVPFRRTDDAEVCKYCDFKTICGR